MYCPNCATQVSADQKFCRSCGLDLQVISQAVAAQLSPTEADKAQIVEIDKHQWTKMWKRWWSIGFAVMFIGIVTLSAGRKLFHNEVVAMLGAMILLIGVWPLMHPLFSAFQVKERRLPKPPQAPALPQAPVTTNPLPDRREAAPSIAERTTDLLATSDAKREKREPRALES